MILYMFHVKRFNHKLTKLFSINRKIHEKAIRTEDEMKFNRLPTNYLFEGSNIVKRRRMINHYNQIENLKKEDSEIFQETYSEMSISMDLFMDHLDYDCQKIDALMNFYKVSYIRNQNIVFLKGFKYNYEDYYFKDKKIEWPMLRVYLSMESVKFIQGVKEIENYLINNEFIINKIHQSNSAWAKQGENFVLTEFKKNLEILFLNPILTIENIFKSAPESYRLGVKSFILIRALRLNLQKIIKSLFVGIPKLISNREIYKSIKQKILDNMNDWENRLNEKKYHGGETPDEADFALYSLINCYYNSFSFRNFLENQAPKKFNSWLIRMQFNCKYEENRFYIK